MLSTRIIPVLLLDGQGLVKTKQFAKPKYVGDPINAVRIFNEKEVDELIFLDIGAGKKRQEPNFELIAEIASEAFIPFAYGGGIYTLDQIDRLFYTGVEKVVVNTLTFTNPRMVEQAAQKFGSQSIVGSVDVDRSLFGKVQLKSHGGLKKQKVSLSEHIRNLEQMGVGEIMINAIPKDGMMQGYDLDLIESVSKLVMVPLIACGGAGSLEHMKDAVKLGRADAAAAGSLFVFSGPHRAVMINYPKYSALKQYFRADG